MLLDDIVTVHCPHLSIPQFLDPTSVSFSGIQMITLGGDAELELVDNLNPFSEGIVFSVRPHKKSWKNISNLSGGEVRQPPLRFWDSNAVKDVRALMLLVPTINQLRPRLRNQESLVALSCSLTSNFLRILYSVENIVVSRARVCAASLQAHAFVRDGRD